MTRLICAFALLCVFCGTVISAAPEPTVVQHVKKPTTKKPPAKSAPKAHKGITAEEEAKILAFTKENLPTMHTRLVDTKTKSTKRYQSLLRTASTHVKALMKMPKPLRAANIALAQSKIQLYELFQSYLKAGKDQEAKDALKPQIRAEIAKQFDAKMAIRVHKLNQVEEQLRQLQADVNRAKENRGKTIDRDTNSMIEHANKGRIPSSLRSHTKSSAPKKNTKSKSTPAKKPAKPAPKPEK
ncbi:MAG: hypothetical protein HN909_02795 [Phycisphaerales bacterium]|jgi:hypothetical protein|nr:hypothetical protein [Phycisphaerales bacterium]MBT7170680.1 hypothetical protein [Phycisphaerales bacterium]